MLAWDNVKYYTRQLAFSFQALAASSKDTPLIGNWCYTEFSYAYAYLMYAYAAEATVGYWLDNAESRLAGILSWATIQANITSTWSWLNTIDDKIWWRARTMAVTYWSWLDTIDDKIRGTAYGLVTTYWPWLSTAPDSIWGWIQPRITGTWSWLNTIDDRIVNTVLTRWTWLNTIDDKIRTVAWDHVAPRLGDWLLAWLLLNLTVWGRIGYRILDQVWNMEWDDTKKEVK